MTAETLWDAFVNVDNRIERSFRRRGNSVVEFAFDVAGLVYLCAASLAVLVVLVAWDSWHRPE